MKKYTHPFKNSSIIVSKNGATNHGYIFTKNSFTNTNFDFREIIENINHEHILTIFIKEYQYTTSTMWFEFERNKNDNIPTN
jgi:hypothetical protein